MDNNGARAFWNRAVILAEAQWRRELLKIYHVSLPDDGRRLGGGAYEEFIVIAESEVEAGTSHPSGNSFSNPDYEWEWWTWVHLNQCHLLKVKEIGVANENEHKRIILASINN